MEDKKCEESCFDEPFGFKETTPCSPGCENLSGDIKQRKKPSKKDMEEYFKMMDAMEQQDKLINGYYHQCL